MNFCPHCHSGNDPVLKDTTWSCGVRFNDSAWRTKECYRRNLEAANDRIKRLEEAVLAYQTAYTPDGHIAPHDCFATGPLTGDPIQDLIVCPGCWAAQKAKEATP